MTSKTQLLQGRQLKPNLMVLMKPKERSRSKGALQASLKLDLVCYHSQSESQDYERVSSQQFSTFQRSSWMRVMMKMLKQTQSLLYLIGYNRPQQKNAHQYSPVLRKAKIEVFCFQKNQYSLQPKPSVFTRIQTTEKPSDSSLHQEKSSAFSRLRVINEVQSSIPSRMKHFSTLDVKWMAH